MFSEAPGAGIRAPWFEPGASLAGARGASRVRSIAARFGAIEALDGTEFFARATPLRDPPIKRSFPDAPLPESSDFGRQLPRLSAKTAQVSGFFTLSREAESRPDPLMVKEHSAAVPESNSAPDHKVIKVPTV